MSESWSREVERRRGEGLGGRRVGESGQSEVPSGSQRGGDTLPVEVYTASLSTLSYSDDSQCGGSWQCNLLVCKLLPMRGVSSADQ